MKRIIANIIIFAVFVAPAIASAENLFYYYGNHYGLSDFKKNSTDIDIVAPQIYEVNHNFEIVTNVKSKVLKDLKKKNVPIMPLLVQEKFDKALMTQILKTPEVQDSIIDFMIKEAKKHDYVGWQFDFENINHLDRDLYVAFVKKTSEALRAKKLLFSVAVIVRANEYNPRSAYQDWSSAYNYKQLGKYVDFMSLMTYDDPRSVGPVASLPYVNAVLDYMLKQVPAEKMSLGVPMYCWQWQDGVRIGSTTYQLAKKAYKKGRNRETGFDEALGAEYFSYKSKKAEMKIWCDNAQSIATKQDLAATRGMRGLSAWALGQGDPNIWDVLRNSEIAEK